MMEKNLGQDVIQTIKVQAIKPRPRWQFLLKDYAVWTAGIFALLVGAFAAAVIIHMMLNNDWDIYRDINDSLLGFILVTLPYFWFICLALFMGVAYYYFQHTKKGYRLSVFKLTVISVIASIFLGGIFYSLGFGQVIDEALIYRSHLYRFLLGPRARIWLSPEKGFLAGVIIKVESPDEFRLLDAGQQQWHVQFRPEDFRTMPDLRLHNMIKMLGRQVDEFDFEARQILPARLRPPMFLGDKVIKVRPFKPLY